MSWKKTSVNGKIMWESPNGERVHSPEQIQLIENAGYFPRSKFPPQYFERNYDDHNIEYHPLTLFEKIISLIIATAIMTILTLVAIS